LQPLPHARSSASRASGLRTHPGLRWTLLLATPLVLLGLASLEIVARGRASIAVVATNLPTPTSSTGKRVIDLVHPTTPEGRVYRIAMVRRSNPPAQHLDGARVQLQLLSRGKTRLLIVQPETTSASRLGALLSLLRGRASLQAVDDRKWVDLGTLPTDGTPLRVHVIGLLPGPFAFAELNQDEETPASERIDVALVPSLAPVGTTTPRYRIVRDAPLAASEALARFSFFIRTSPVLLGATIVAVIGLCAGWALLAGPRAWAGILLLVTSVTLLHAVLLPPLQGADETSQIGTIEWILSDPSPTRAWRYPESISTVAHALEQDRVQYHANEPLPVGSAQARARLAPILGSPLRAESTAGAEPPPAAGLQVISLRAPLFFAPYPALGSALRTLSIIDRISAYRLVATIWCLLAFGAGLALLRWGQLPLEVGLAYGLVFLLPYTVGVAATCSNYAPAIGTGFLFAAGVVTTILSTAPAARRIAGGVALATAWAGVPIWPDFLALAILASVVSAGLVAWHALRQATPGPAGARPALQIRFIALVGAMIAAAAAIAWRNFPWFDARLPRIAAEWQGMDLAMRAALLVAPPVLAALAAGFYRTLRGASAPARRRRALTVCVAIAILLVTMFVLTPYTEVPYERVFLALPDLARAHMASFWSNTLSFDQDRLGWKFFFGAFGWHDTYYPEVIYAAARWAFVLFLIALPVLGLDFASARPRAASRLILVAGVGVSLSVATLLARHAMSIHPHGRFTLPYLPLVAFPVLALVATPSRRGAFRRVLRIGVALNVWTSIAVLGVRYYVQQ